ncbi:MAG: RICIN domain-containing protein [Verrucomicrobiota bacterium JB022]|nr:RICIN domain-containing protein [Verrucomicrobiota bacterium JB022]
MKHTDSPDVTSRISPPGMPRWSSPLLLILAFLCFGTSVLQAYANEVFWRNGYYRWKTFDVERGQTSDLATAINNCIETGNRDVHILVGGNLNSQINLQPGLNIYGHNNTFQKTHNGYGFYRDGSGSIGIYDLILTGPRGNGMGIRTSRASNVSIRNVRITGGSIGIRVDSHPSRPYEAGRWVTNLSVIDCSFDNGSSHGLETYGVDGVEVSQIYATNMGECGVLFNKSINGHVGSVYAYRCSYGGGYAGLRFANDCAYFTVENATSIECGRGLFVLTGSNNIQVNNVYIANTSDIGIWLENVANCTVVYGANNSGTAVSGSGSSSNTTSNLGSFGIKRLSNRGTGMFLDGLGAANNGADVGQWSGTVHLNANWGLIPVGSNYYVVNQGTGLKLDGYGRTTNGEAAAQHTASSQHPNAQWTLQSAGSGYYYLVNVGTGMKLDGYGRTTNGESAAQYSGSTTHVNAQWQLVN